MTDRDEIVFNLESRIAQLHGLSDDKIADRLGIATWQFRDYVDHGIVPLDYTPREEESGLPFIIRFLLFLSMFLLILSLLQLR